MKTTFVSTVAVATSLRQSILKTQGDLVSAQKEAATGRFADVGLTLGGRAGWTISLRQEHARLNAIVDSNALASSRLDATQAALGDIRGTAKEFLGALIALPDGATGANVLQEQAATGLKGLIHGLNASIAGEYLFGGINAAAQPVADYFATPAAANKQAVDNAFLAAFGVAQGDPGVGAISATDMQTFLDGAFRSLFDDPQWSDWSAASSQDRQSRITATEVVESSVNANEQAMRKIAMAYTMVADLGVQGLNEGARRAVTETATQLIAEGINEVTALQAKVGGVQGRIGQVNDRMSMQLDILSRQVAGLEGVDPFEAASRVNVLMTQLETGYALTARMQRLSILDYL
jgi:flagellar hook-associated protein 3 FlgL